MPKLVAGLLLLAAWGSLRIATRAGRLTVALLWVTRRKLQTAPPRIIVVAVLGVCSIDLSEVDPPVPEEIVCVTVGGRAEVRIPGSWRLTAASPLATWRVQVREEGSELNTDDLSPPSSDAVMIRLLGVGGGVGFARVWS